MTPRGMPPLARLEASATPEPNTGCWLWTLRLNKHGYGVVKHGGRMMTAHRFAWFAASGEMPPADRLVCHRCDNRACVNPAHLYLGTVTDNNRDAHRRGRAAPQHGEHNPHSKLTALAVADMRRRRADGEPLLSIAASYGVGKSTVCMVTRGHTWTRATEDA
jgi:hypothetical protein